MCNECLHALQSAGHRDYQDGCLGCGIRRLAHMGGMERAVQLDRIQHVHGWGARSEAVRLLEIEVSRIRKLRAMAREGHA
jgi:hypothetical protein